MPFSAFIGWLMADIVTFSIAFIDIYEDAMPPLILAPLHYCIILPFSSTLHYWLMPLTLLASHYFH
jgi:hypothetical protein